MGPLLFHYWFKVFGGAEKLVYEYLKRTKYKYDLLTYYYDGKAVPDIDSLEIRKISIFPKSLKKLFSNAILSAGFVAFFTPKVELPKYDFLLMSEIGISSLAMLKLKIDAPKIAYVHTPARAAFPLDMVYNPKYAERKGINKFIYKVAAFTFNKFEKKAWKKIDLAIFNSRLSLWRAKAKGLISEDKALVIYPGANLDKIKNGEAKDYLLYVARFSPAKRQHILIKAFAKVVKKFRNVKLVLAGSVADKRYLEKIEREIINLGLQKRVIIKTNVPSKEILDLYANALAFVHIPFMEDFGIAPLEAAAAGKYIINVYPSGNYEILKDFPGIYWIKEPFNENKLIEEVSKAMSYFLENKDSLIELGKGIGL